jgi:hypothetical protein
MVQVSKVTTGLVVVLALGGAHSTAGLFAQTHFVRGDVDANGGIEVTDAIRVLGFLFLGSPQSFECSDAADVDDNEAIEITDAIRVLGWLFLGSEPPLPPSPDAPRYSGTCGMDPGPCHVAPTR